MLNNVELNKATEKNYFLNFLLLNRGREEFSKLIDDYAESLLGAGAITCFGRAAEYIKDCRHWNDENYSALRSMLSGYEGLAMAGTLWPWEGRRADTVATKKRQFIIVMCYVGVSMQEISVLLEGNPRVR